jgi:hypothetical protein
VFTPLHAPAGGSLRYRHATKPPREIIARDFAGTSSPVAHWGGTGQLTALASNLPHSGRSLDAYLHRPIVIFHSGSRFRFFS